MAEDPNELPLLGFVSVTCLYKLHLIFTREGLGCPKDIPRSVAHLSVAASWGHVRSMNFIAHALFDADSWLLQYGREQEETRRKDVMLELLSGMPSNSSAKVGGVADGQAADASTNRYYAIRMCTIFVFIGQS